MTNRLYGLSKERPGRGAISEKQRCHLIALLTEDQDDTPRRTYVHLYAIKPTRVRDLRALVQISCRYEDAVGHERRPSFTDLSLHVNKGDGVREVAGDVSMSSIIELYAYI